MTLTQWRIQYCCGSVAIAVSAIAIAVSVSAAATVAASAAHVDTAAVATAVSVAHAEIFVAASAVSVAHTRMALVALNERSERLKLPDNAILRQFMSQKQKRSELKQNRRQSPIRSKMAY